MRGSREPIRHQPKGPAPPPHDLVDALAELLVLAYSDVQASSTPPSLTVVAPSGTNRKARRD